MRWMFGILSLLLAAPAVAEVQVRAVNGLVDVQAKGAPLSEILERLAKETGMKVTYDGAPQRIPVSLALKDRTPAQAVLGVLDGLGLDYAMCMDPTGRRVDTLMIVGVASAPSTGTGPERPMRSVTALPPPPAIEAEEEPLAEEEPDAIDETPRTPTQEAQKAVAAALAAATGARGPSIGPTPASLPSVPAFPTSSFAPQPSSEGQRPSPPSVPEPTPAEEEQPSRPSDPTR